MPDSFSLVWGHSVHFAKFPILRFSKHYSFNSFHQTSTERYTKYHNPGVIYDIVFFFRSARNSKYYGTLKCLLTQDHMGLEMSKCYSSYSFRPMSAKFYEGISYYGGIQDITFLGNRPSSKHFVALWNINMGKPKMWNILKTADRRAKRTKMWDSGPYSACM